MMTSPICESVAVCMDRKYYQAYEDRYKQVHRKNLSWFSSAASQIVMDTIRKYYGEKSPKILDVGCGEGRDILFLLDKGYDVTGVDISAEAIKFCKAKAGETDKHRFQVLDVCTQACRQPTILSILLRLYICCSKTRTEKIISPLFLTIWSKMGTV